MTGALVTLLAFPLVGLAVSRFVGRSSPYLLGLATTGTVLYAALLLHLPIGIVFAVLVGGAALVVLFRRGPSPSSPPRERSLIAAVLIGIPLTVALAHAVIAPLDDYDGVAFWVLKAKAIAHEGAIDGPFFQGLSTYNPRNEYPLLMPLNAAAVMNATGSLDDINIRLLYVLVFVSFVIEVRRRFETWFSSTTAAWSAVALAWLPQFHATEGGAGSGYSDMAVAAFASCAFFELAGGGSAARFGLWLAALVLTKNEGLPLAFIFLLPGVVVFRVHVLRAVIPLASAVAILVIWRRRIPAGDEDQIAERLPDILQRLDRFPELVAAGVPHLIDVRSWGLFWVLSAGALAVLLFRRDWKRAALPAFVIAAVGSLYGAVYMVTTWRVIDLVNSSAPRLLMHITVPALFLMAAAWSRRTSSKF